MGDIGSAGGARRGVLAGVRVVELGHGPLTGLVTMVLADFGADVLWLDCGSSLPPASESYAVWMRGKSRLAVDAGSDAQRIRQAVLDTADVFVTSLDAQMLVQLGLDEATLARSRGDLVSARLAAFPGSDDLAALPHIEGLAAARMGRMLAFEGVATRPGPVCTALKVGTHATAQSACAAILAALLVQREHGQGQHVETSLLHGLLPYEMAGLLALQLDHEAAQVSIDPHQVMPTLNYHPVRCADGRWLQLGNLLPHLFASFLRAAGLDDILNDADFAQQPWPAEVLERYRRRLLEHMQTRDLEDWMRLFLADGGVVAHPYQTTQQALDDPDVADNGHAVTDADLVQLGVLARLEATPAAVAAPLREVSWSQVAAPPLRRRGGRARGLPLRGVTVLECATIIAAPFGASMLADLGARVIKVEALGDAVPGEPFRAMLGGLGALRVNTGKESICLDLKHPQAQEVVQTLARQADVLIHNYRAGVPERLGLGYDGLSASNPRLVYVAVNGYGPDGPGARRPSTHPIPGAALGGVVHQFGGMPDPGPREVEALRDQARRLFRANEVNPDPNTSLVVATAALLGLCASRWQGKGQRVWVDMFGANAYSNFDDFLSYPGKPPRSQLDDQLLGFGPLERLYPCTQGWIFLGIDSDAGWRRFRDALPAESSAASDLGAFASLADCSRQADVLMGILERLFATDTADAWEARLVPQGIGCLRADRGLPGQLLHSDPYFQRHRLTAEVADSPWGRYRRHGPLVQLSSAMSAPPACTAGQHTRPLLEELGMSSADVDRLLAAGIAR